MGPIMTPTPHTAMAEPCFAGGLMSSNTAWESGTSAAPHSPCSSRASTICANDPATPHSTDASVNPAMETRNTRFSPNRSVSQPDKGVAMPAATMYEVRTQVIWSCEADRLPCMCGSATFAIVPSIAWITVASMIDSVIMRRSTAPKDSELSPTAWIELILIAWPLARRCVSMTPPRKGQPVYSTFRSRPPGGWSSGLRSGSPSPGGSRRRQTGARIQRECALGPRTS